MRVLYILPRPNLDLSAPVGHAIRIRELIKGFVEINANVFIISAGKQSSAYKAKQLFRSGIKRRLPAFISGLIRDLFYIGYDHIFQNTAIRNAETLLPFDFIIEHYSFFCQTGVSVARRYNKPLILDDIAPIWEEEVYFRRDLKKIAQHIQEGVFQQATACIAVSGSIQEYLISCGVPKEKIHIVANGADCERFRPGVGGNKIREIYHIQDKIVVGFVGSFAPWHGIDFLISSAIDLVQIEKNIHFLVVGDGPQRAELELQVKDNNLADWITFTGSIPFDNVPPYIDAMDITVVPNTTTYCSPIKIFEYMAMEKVVIAPRFNPIKEIITEGLDGILFSPGDRNDFTHLILDLIYNYKRRSRIGTAARQKIINNYTWARQAKRISEIILPQ